jgi:hypothetical protein
VSFPLRPEGAKVFIKAFWSFGDRLIRRLCQFGMIKWVNKEKYALTFYIYQAANGIIATLCCHREKLPKKRNLHRFSKSPFSRCVERVFCHVFGLGWIYSKTVNSEKIWMWILNLKYTAESGWGWGALCQGFEGQVPRCGTKATTDSAETNGHTCIQ